MGNWSVQQEAKKEVKEKDKVRREKLAGFFKYPKKFVIFGYRSYICCVIK